MTKEPAAFKPHWPQALKQNQIYRVPCDDKGRNGTCWLQVIIGNDGDVHVSMFEKENPEDAPNPIPSVRIRTFAGGGRHCRTRQALLWLAEAIRMDAEELRCSHE